MSLRSEFVGISASEPVEVTARWMMAFAASVGATGPKYLDTASTAGIVAHPVFPVALEWPAMLALADTPEAQQLTAMERARNVHGALDLHLLRPIEPGVRLTVEAMIVSLEQRGQNTHQVVKVEFKNKSGDVLCRSFQTGIFLGTALDGENRCIASAPEVPAWDVESRGDGVDRNAREPTENVAFCVGAGAGQIYSECARIWNPIHSDREVALAAGLPGVILHGTATLAIAITHLVGDALGGDPSHIARLGCQFRGMVPQPSSLHLKYQRISKSFIGFEVLNEQEKVVIKQGYILHQ